MKDPLIESDISRRRATTLVMSERNFKIPLPEINPFPFNKISTSKYNCVTFLPKNLWFQFQKLANVYFLVVAVLQAIPEISVSGGVPNILLPLGFVLTVSAIKDLLEDMKRKRSDNEENNRLIKKRQNSQWVKIKWEQVKVGDVLFVSKDEYFPADMILLSSCDTKGICYIETKNLDGETNLKHKLANKSTQEYFSDPSKFDYFTCSVKCEDPNPMIYNFNGLLKIEGITSALSNEQFLLRGSSLKNTDWIAGLVVYTGHQTKIMLNSAKSRAKVSSLESYMNREVIYIFLLQLGICVFCASYYAIWYTDYKYETDIYLDLTRTGHADFVEFIVIFFTWTLIFTNFVPISLIVTLEMVKFLQAVFIAWDLKLYYEPTDTPAGVQSSNLNEELGQINYVFSDKTGTLTCNVMEFRKFSVLGTSYGTDDHLDLQYKIPHVDFVDNSLDHSDPMIIEFMMHLACCHTIISEMKDGELVYKASSPDELALVNAAKFFGYEFIARDQDMNIEIKIGERKMHFKLLNVIEFTSDRKRMTVIVKNPDGKIKLLCKGADSVILPRLNQSDLIPKTWNHLEKYANEGLRTLVIASRELSESEYLAWNLKFEEAMQDIHHREEKVNEVGEEIEQKLNLIGATAIEDKLQDNVPSTIKALRDAGVKIWVLTGDKVETAVNIGFSCNLLTSEMVRILVTSPKTQQVSEELDRGIKSFGANTDTHYALVVSGEALLKAMRGELVKKLILVTDKCNVVLACRVSPQQKADIVKMIRNNKIGARTLSIGDGANDVNMITAAHVGVGIAGLEGAQAVRASDYSVAQFSYLKRLMFVHGRESYRKNATLICYNFYKNVLLVIPLFCYGIFSAYSGQILYNTWTYQTFNIFFASLPIVIYALFDKEISYKRLEGNPMHYLLGLKGRLFNTSIFWLWILEASLQGLAITIVVMFSLCGETSSIEGRTNSMWTGSALIFAIVVIVANGKVVEFSYSHYWFSLTILSVSVLLYFFILAILTEWLPVSEWLDNYDSKGSLTQMFADGNTYLCSILLIFSFFFYKPLITHTTMLIDLIRKKKIVMLEDEELEDSDREKALQELPLEEKVAAQISLQKLSVKHTGFAFSGEAGHVPQITEKYFRSSTELLT
ncbi:ATP8A1_3 [Blepharisma stoltei]|uniref:Phospholipid-transporting ATPase n=1 Tax=Blepharisma stoltei TaxID=1481888 RepID=A0AAU9JPK6_9CILI|nr:unnamed protein product [Blepharisma stoltei]